MAITPLLKEFKKIRIDNDVSRSQMAEQLGISELELKNIEWGKSPATYGFLRMVAERYSSDEQRQLKLFESLNEAMVDSVTSVTFDMTGLNRYHRRKVLDLKDQIERELAKAHEQMLEQLSVESKELIELGETMYVNDMLAPNPDANETAIKEVPHHPA